jgi:site-specific DNA recombinase
MLETPKLVRVGLYARVSSDAQKENETMARQIVALEERIRQDGQVLTPDLRFIDDGWSGSTLVRPDWER